MTLHKLIIASDEETFKFAQENYPDNFISRRIYLSCFFSLFSRKKGLPCFLSNDTALHHQDIENIKTVQNKNKIEKKDLSVVVLDAHTDMYRYDDPRILELQGENNMTNWILHMLDKGYDDISILGVSDFTKSCPEKGSFEYHRMNERVHFFIGRDFDRQYDFKEDGFSQVELRSLSDFMRKKLRKYSFISLDSDVSDDFAGHPRYGGYRGKTRVSEIIDIISYVGNNSHIIGFSLYGMYGDGFFSTFSERKDIVRKVLESL